MYENLVFNFSYIDLICLETGIHDEALNSLLISSASEELKLKNSRKVIDRMALRLDRADKFVSYLENQEKVDEKELNLSIQEMKYSKKLREQFDVERERIMKSAEKNAN